MNDLGVNTEHEKLQEEYYYGIGRLNTAFQFLENAYKDMYYSFVNEHFKDDKNFRAKFTTILNKFENKIRLFYDNDETNLNRILKILDTSRKLSIKRSYYIHSYLKSFKNNDEPEKLYLYKRTKDSILPYEIIEGKMAVNDDFKLLDINDIINTTNELNTIGMEIVILGHSLGSKRQGSNPFAINIVKNKTMNKEIRQ